ncbi:hypothetical protein LNAOJCKE_0970 [Methylorubrum aminovorans]|uniref:Uncharacterized protein n=1 Tax=Methylorubrum aminovorans TaxID=269069 RepID=A0ABQ4UBE1_9HYPH|nr:hypothetical protein LNAOJCKE_0970 [Methylorubrum aminovorans]GMA73613.1 hypothetical protein GCM10025880_00300 [Methylorubrum aminovorans]GMA73701.1 hypothetical protein GCM10025880_01180 [Methylorubrum aminovorans]
MTEASYNPCDAGKLIATIRKQPNGSVIVRLGVTSRPGRILAATTFYDAAYADRLVAAINEMASRPDPAA